MLPGSLCFGAGSPTRLLVEAVCPASGEQGESQLTQNYKDSQFGLFLDFTQRRWCLCHIDHFCSGGAAFILWWPLCDERVSRESL